MDSIALAGNIYKLAHLTGTFKGRSGIALTEYFDKYLFEAHPEILDAICDKMVTMIPEDTLLLAGLEMGGIPIATILSQKSHLSTRFVRKKAKEYGTCRLVEEGVVKGFNLTIIEDVVTSGGQIIVSTNKLRMLGANVGSAICVIDRELGGREKLEKTG